MSKIETVLIADDSALARTIVKRCLEIAGLSEITFLEACDGKEALESVKTNQVDLILTDLNMPNLDGKAFLKQLKSRPKTVNIPVIVITSLHTDTLVDELMGVGAYAILKKPVSLSILSDIIQNLCDVDSWG